MHCVEINPADPASIDRARRTEWLLTNGLGGFAMGSALGANTRRYHGLLIVATKPPVGRILALHSLGERLLLRDGRAEGASADLFSHQFGPDELLHPDGHRHLIDFECDGLFARWRWRVGGAKIERRLNLVAGRHAARIEYRIEGHGPRMALHVRPFVALRDFHSLAHEGALRRASSPEPGAILIEGDGLTLRLQATGAAIDARIDPQWWRDYRYAQERMRGQDHREDCFTPGYFEIACGKGLTTAAIDVELIAPTLAAPAASKAAGAAARSEAARQLQVAAGQFVVRREDGGRWSGSVIAGYPWFADWGRDTMISLPGLMLCTGRVEEARSTLLNFSGHLQRGLIPNCFHDSGTVEHNTVDASLWFVHAVGALHAAAPRLVDRSLIDACREIVAAYRHGTDHGIRMDIDGLIVAGDASTQLTWMDAKRDGVAFTPRHGKAVEINALWFSALRSLAAIIGPNAESKELGSLSDRVEASFRTQFWWPERQCLHDVLAPTNGGDRAGAARGVDFTGDQRVRPNQVFAASLPHSPLNREQQRAVVKIVKEQLLTPYGLRTLERTDPAYRGRYEGDLWQRDSSYHQGTVWPWLIGPYIEALLRADDFSAAAKAEATGTLQPLIDEMSNAGGGRCLGQIAEVYDGDEPHRPSGCPAQAWSVAEALRALTLIERGRPVR